MRTCIVQAKKAGGNLIITLPREIIEGEQLTPDTFVRISVEKIKGQNLPKKQEDSLGPEDPWRLLE
jgi:antitoxin component of MazEF toxin-antitoxin module